MQADAQLYNRMRPHHAPRLQALVDYHAYTNLLARYIGCQPQLWRFWNRPRLLYFCLFGPYASYQYRLHGNGANFAKAMEAVDQLPLLPLDRVLQHAVLYAMKPWFYLLSRLGFRNLKPVF